MTQPPASREIVSTLEWMPVTLEDREIVETLRTRRPIARDVGREIEEGATLGERLSDRIAAFGGSWTFILLFMAFLVFWALLNTEILGPRKEAFDPYPYIFLNLFLSMVAALQAPIILMSQNRGSARDRIHAASDYQVNLKAEIEIRAFHDKLDALRESDWENLVQMQRQQIEMLTRLLEPSVGRGSS